MALVPVSDESQRLAFLCNIEIFLDAIKRSGNPNTVDKYGRTPLCTAIEHFRSAELVKALLELGADPNATSCIGKRQFLAESRLARWALRGTALHAAVTVGKLEIIKHLLAKGADVDPKTSKGLTPLQLSLEGDVYRDKDREPLSKDGNLELVTALLESGADVGMTYPRNKDTLLHNAARIGNDKIICFLLSTGYKWDIDAPNKSGKTVLHLACDDPCLTELILQHGADPNSLCILGNTPYHYACANENLEVMEILYKHGANANVANYRGFTALHLVVMNRHPNEEVVQTLFRHNVDPCAGDNLGRTAHYYLTSYKTSPAGRLLCLLAGAGGDLKRRDSLGVPLLHSIVKYLLKATEIIEIKHGNKEMFEQIVDAYVKAGVDVNARDPQNRTVLHLAAADGVIHFVETLLRFHADVNAKDCDGNTPLHIAAKHGYKEVIKVLKTTKNARTDIPNDKMETVDEILGMKIRELRSLLDRGKTFGFTNITYLSPQKWSNLEEDIALLMDLMKTMCKKGEDDVQQARLDSLMEETSSTANIEENSSQPIGASIPWNVADLKPMSKELCEDRIFFEFLCHKKSKKPKEVEEDNHDDTVGHDQGDANPSIQDKFPNISSCISEYCQQYCLGKFHLNGTCEDEKCKIALQVRGLVEDLVASCVEMDSRLNCEIFLTGSTAEGTKMWAPDEFDFMMELSNLEGHCDIDATFAGNNLVLVLREEVRPIWQEFLDEEGRFSPTQLRNYVALLLWKASLSLQKHKFPNLHFNLGQYHNNSCSGCSSDQPLVKFSKVGVCLHLRWFGDQYKNIEIDVDITPAIKFQSWSGNYSLPTSFEILKECGCHLIPLVSGDLEWRVSFSMAELRLMLQLSDQQLNIYKAVKLLRDIHAKEGGTPSYLLKTMVFNYLFKKKADFSIHPDLASHVYGLLCSVSPEGPIRHFFTSVYLQIDSISSLHWLESAVKLLREDSERALESSL